LGYAVGNVVELVERAADPNRENKSAPIRTNPKSLAENSRKLLI
jgi:hypothetical protein